MHTLMSYLGSPPPPSVRSITGFVTSSISSFSTSGSWCSYCHAPTWPAQRVGIEEIETIALGSSRWCPRRAWCWELTVVCGDPSGHLFKFFSCLHWLFTLQEMPLQGRMLTASVLASFKCQLHHKLESFWKREPQLRNSPRLGL